MLWDVGTVAITIDTRGREIMDTARLQRCYGMLSMPFQNENNGQGMLRQILSSTEKYTKNCFLTRCHFKLNLSGSG